jgi:hypothetical protein
MVGGEIVGLARGAENTLVHVQDVVPYDRDFCSIRVTERRIDTNEPVELNIGDSIWWQSGNAMWTPKAMKGHAQGEGCGKTWDIALKKVGYSH